MKMTLDHVYGEGKVASPTDYVAVGISALTIFILLCGTFFSRLIHGVREIKTKQIQLLFYKLLPASFFAITGDFTQSFYIQTQTYLALLLSLDSMAGRSMWVWFADGLPHCSST